MSERKSVSIQQQADFLDRLVARCSMHSGKVADEAMLTITKDEAQFIQGIADRLVRMAVHEDRIRKLVMTGR